ncbi:replicative DNA helicase [Caldanaerobius fijiensis DSM 17918]|uniref:Replicative DNA helicase n=1 Tax=Caldanaerobius fijiensis DSM 17918 TaxID=1121256 RepID=A0A1M5AS23_9THEO|nr:replicative DNA helicase [Caldanaerobius fijiensis]SHF32966.1 replicative DNA helicase [Caldanaerobius fijiensis DSM 17918]
MQVRVPPHNIEAEQAVLGAILLDNDVITDVVELLKPEDFYRESHSIIYRTILELYDKNQPVDLITVTDELNQRKLLDKVGGAAYLTSLVAGVTSISNVQHYCKIIEEKAVMRRLIVASSEIMDAGYSESDDVEGILDIAEQKIFDIAQSRNRQPFTPIKDILIETIDRIDELYKNKGKIIGLPSGFVDLDMKTSGFQPSDLILIAARPSMGKTAMAMNIVEYVAIKQKVPVMVFSLEMSKQQLTQRLLCSLSMVDSHKLRMGDLTEEDWPKLAAAVGILSEAPIYIDDTPAITTMEMRAKCRRLKLEKGLGLVVIDYLQLMQSNKKAESRQQEVSEISRSLKALAREIDVPVIALSQLSRAPETRSDHRPMLSDLRESGSIEQDADIVMFLYRDDYYNPDTDKKNIAEVIIAKQRNGPTGTVELAWLGQYTKFANIARNLKE